MSKYQPLSQRLAASPGDEWRTSFSELESILGFPLPKAARAGRAWWSNDLDKGHSRAWAAQGWEVGDLDHAAERVVFRRGAASGVALARPAPLAPLQDAGAAEPSPPAREIHPPALCAAAEDAPARTRAARALGAAAVLTAGAAVVAGLGAALIRGVVRRR